MPKSKKRKTKNRGSGSSGRDASARTIARNPSFSLVLAAGFKRWLASQVDLESGEADLAVDLIGDLATLLDTLNPESDMASPTPVDMQLLMMMLATRGGEMDDDERALELSHVAEILEDNLQFVCAGPVLFLA